ncbi:hypothetical protein GCM10023187_04470 [Nibrella viscosa]|uniref:YD repeat-containing protein n=1 Tax=Nibrella viscosa TaxID=1084524 RepID=A0ABP8JUJ9_9BACT
MKTVVHVNYRLAVALTLHGLIIGCGQKQTEVSKAETDCRLQQVIVTRKPGNSTTASTEQTSYVYDAQGRVTGTTFTNADASGSGVRSSVTYAYNADGFLDRSEYQWSSQARLGSGGVQNYTKTATTRYSYTNRRLTGYTVESSGTIVPTMTLKAAYTYTASGELMTESLTTTYQYDPAVKEIPSVPSGFQQSWTYSGGKLTDYVEKSGSVETHPYTIQNGLVTRYAFQGGYSTYQYDSGQRLTKFESFSGNTLNHYYTFEYSEGKPALAARPGFTGVPDAAMALPADILALTGRIPAGRGPFGQPGVVKRYRFYANYTGGEVIPLTDMVYASQLNSQGFVGSQTIDMRDLTPGMPASMATTAITETYTYSNCR